MKDTDEQPYEIHRARSERISSTGASVSMELVGVHHLPCMWMCSLTWKIFEPHTLGVFMEASSCGHDKSLTPFSALLLALESGSWG